MVNTSHSRSKWSKRPTLSDTNHLHLFLNEYPAKKGFLVCQIPYRQKLSNQVSAIPWQEIPMVMEEFLETTA